PAVPRPSPPSLPDALPTWVLAAGDAARAAGRGRAQIRLAAVRGVFVAVLEARPAFDLAVPVHAAHLFRVLLPADPAATAAIRDVDRKSTRLNSSHVKISYA